MQSPTFTTGEEGKLKWTLRLYPNGYDNGSKNFLSLKLCLLSGNWPSNASVALSVARNNRKYNTVHRLADELSTIDDNRKIKRENYFLVKKLIAICWSSSYGSSDKTLSITCDMFFYGHDINIHQESGLSPTRRIEQIPAIQRLTEFNDFEGLMESGEFSDVLVIVGDKDFHVHKNILAARSRVFSAMVQHEMIKQNKGIVEILDIDAEVMQEVLRFIYTGKVNNLQMLTFDLLSAAEKYELQGLKTVCEDVITSTSSVGNIGAILIFLDAHDYDSEKLRKSALHFLTMNAKTLMDINDFKTLLTSLSSNLLEDVMSSVMYLLPREH